VGDVRAVVNSHLHFDHCGTTPYNIDEVDPAGAPFRRTDHDDQAFVGKVSELVSLT
jgi:glyoxylase-like metal-dependent hydrolase (beta-lactamase superfamily II)